MRVRQLCHPVKGLRSEGFRIAANKAAKSDPGTVHLSASDASGDLVIFECLSGKFTIRQGKDYLVMNWSWKTIGASTMLNRSCRRSLRGSLLQQRLRMTTDS